jgi:DNA-binding transcriptional LysR family regulator
MFVRQLNYLVALARERHFARAAEACHVSQPTLSAAIHHLEEELGVSIVKRGQRFEGFTTEGERVLSWAQRILADWDGLRQDVRGMRGQPVGELRCGTIPTALPVAALLNGPCRERYPLITPIVLSLPSVDIVRGIESFELEVGLSYLDDEHRPHLRELPLYRERYVLVTKDASRATPNGRIGWAEAATMPLCLLTSNMQNRQIIDAAFQQAGEPPRVTAETDSILAMYASVCYGGLACIVPHSLLVLFPRQHAISVMALEPALSRQVGLISMRRDPSPPVVEAFANVVREIDVQSRIEELIAGVY